MPPQLNFCRMLDFCDDCRAPIYMENVRGACTCEAGKLRAIQAHLRIQSEEIEARRKTAASHLTQTRNVTLPSISRAVQAVAQAREEPTLEAILMNDARQSLGLPQEALQHTASAPVRTASVQAQPRSQAQARSVDLSSLWSRGDIPADAMESDASDVVSFFPSEDPPDFSPNEIQFDGEIDFNDAGPRMASNLEAVRFRADQGLPQHEPFNGRTFPTDGRTVGSIRGVRETAQRVQQSRPERPVPTPAPIRTATAPQPRSGPDLRPTAYDRINSGFLDDD